MGLLNNHLKKAQGAAPAAAPAPAPQVKVHDPVEVTPPPKPAATATATAPARSYASAKVVPAPVAAPIPPPVTSRAVVVADPFALLMGEGNDLADTILNAVMAQADEKPSYDGAFPHMTILPGAAGGMFAPSNNVPGDVMHVMPQGKNAFVAVFLGYRLKFVAWTKGYEEGGEHAAPLHKGNVFSGDAEAIDAVLTAAEVYQFTPKLQKPKFDDSLGHFKVAVELLLRRGGVIFTLATPTHYSSTQKTLVALGKALPNGQLKPVPLRIAPKTETINTTPPSKQHMLEIALATDAEGKAEFEDWKASREAILGDEQFKTDYATWSATDITEAGLAAAQAVAAMKK